MKSTVMNFVKASTLVALGLAIGAMGIYVGEADDAPGAGGLGLLLMVAGVVLGVKVARNRLPTWAARTALAVGVVAAVFAALLTRGVAAAPLFPRPDAVPSVVGSAPPPQYAAAVERARALVRAAIVEQDLPGVSVAVGVGLPSGAFANEGQPSEALAKAGAVVWAEGFGWRDVGTRTPVTAATRFNIGTAASAIIPSVGPLGLTHTGAEAAKEWSPEAIGEEGEDFPPLTLLRHHVWQPLGLMPMEYPLPADRATFYVPRSADNDPRRGRRLMYMRDLACCADGMAFSSTPSDLVRVALATNAGHVNGELAGGMVTSLATARGGIVVAVTSNIAYANTPALARRIGETFADQTR
jgi:hypothetical protein